jgi:hypothetical protein
MHIENFGGKKTITREFEFLHIDVICQLLSQVDKVQNIYIANYYLYVG